MKSIQSLIAYGIKHRLCEESDLIYIANQLADLFKVEPNQAFYDLPITLESFDDIFNPLFEKALNLGLIEEDSVHEKDAFEAKVMDLLVMRPSGMQKHFNKLYLQSPKEATDQFYAWAQASNYIKTQRMEKNIPLTLNTRYGEIKGTINLAKPEKDPKAIAAASSSKGQFPACHLCKEYVGLNQVGHPPRANHRMIQLKLNQENFFFQFSPYVYYHQHAIIIHEEHIPMKMTKDTFKRLFDFVDQFPHYFLGSNAGLPIVGGSILSHEHYQGGYADFPLDHAHVLKQISHPTLKVELIDWPLSVIRLKSKSKEAIIEMAHQIDQTWQAYSNEALDIIAYTDQRHNAITPIARKIKDEYVLMMALRNNRTSETYPEGIFHIHENNEAIKKENIGLIEVMGLGVLPGRLALELPYVEEVLKGQAPINQLSTPMQSWTESIKAKQPQEISLNWIQEEAMQTFVRGLEDCAVFPHNEEGLKAFTLFIQEATQ